MAKYTYNDIVRVRPTIKVRFDVPGRRTQEPRAGEHAWIYSAAEDRQSAPRSEFPPGVLYGVEFEDGDSIEVHEDDLDLVEAIGREA